MSTQVFAHCDSDGRVCFTTSHPIADGVPLTSPGLQVILVENPPEYWDGLKMDLNTRKVVDDQRPAPPDDDFQTWAWNPVTKRNESTPTRKAIAKKMRTERDALVDESDKLAMKYVGDGLPVPAPLKAYRQALRDVPQQPGFPTDIIWPTPP